MNIKKLAVSAATGAIMFGAMALPVFAAPGDNGQGFGGCVDTLYGNATNERPSGHGVLPSQSPGPWLNTGFNEPPRNDRLDGPSMGEVMQFVTSAGFTGADLVNAPCQF